MRNFESGATRDSEEDKLDYEGFLSPLVLRRYAQYMHTHRKQADGSLRDSDNWQKGIPPKVYMKSLIRHTFDLWHLRRNLPADQDDFENLLCAIMFNSMGLLYESQRSGE
jgi:hypothetical protein